MTLSLTSLRVTNFGPYYGQQTVELNTPVGSPVVLVHGENTLGKTQLFAALRWCLYGSFQPQQSQPVTAASLRERFNRKAVREDEDHSLEVRVTFTANDEPYVLIRRAQDHGNRLDVTADLRIGPSVVAAADIEAEIGRLMHPQISEFFLFDAELLQRFYDRLNTDRERAFIKHSIESVLGIPALQRAESDVADLAMEASRKQAKFAKDSGEAARLSANLRRLGDERISGETDRRTTADKLREAEQTRDNLREQMGAVEGLQADVREQELLEAQSADSAREEEQIRADAKALFTTGWLTAAARPLSLALSQVQTANSRAQQEQGDIQDARLQVKVLEDRVKGGMCPSCHQPLPPPDSATESELAETREHLSELLASNGGGVVDLARERRLTALVDLTTAKGFKDKNDRLNELATLQYERKMGMTAIAERLKGHKAADIRSLGQQLSRTDSAISGAQRALRDIDRRLSEIATEEQATMRKLTRLKGSQPDVAFEAAFFSFVRSAFNQTIERYRERVRTDVEVAANEMFLSLIHDPDGYGGLRISSDYHVEVLDRFKARRETSEGGKQLVALSLIGALKHAAVRGGPVVLDSPLGRLDLEHRANVLQTWIPALGNQAVLLVQSGELTIEDAHRRLGARIGREYRIVRPDNDPEHAVIEGVR